jgi:hypothetical protein
VIVSVAVFGVAGAGLGALLGSEVIAVAGLLLYLYAAGPLLSRIAAAGSWTAWLPGVAADGLPRPARRACGCRRPGRAAWCSPPGLRSSRAPALS